MQLPQIDENSSFAILGLGKFGMSIARELCESGYHVLCCDKNAALVHEIADVATNAVEADINDPTVLASLGIGNFDVVIVAFSDDFEGELLTTMIAKELGAPFVLAKATGIRQKKILESIGADKVIMPETEMGLWVAKKMITNDPMDYIHYSDDYEIVEMDPKREWVGNTLSTLNLRKNNSLNVLALIRDEQLVPDISADTIIQAHDRIVALHIIK